MRINEILTKARYSLSDINETRWTDNRLLSLFNDALEDIVLNTTLFNTSGYLLLLPNVQKYNLSKYMIQLLRVENNKNDTLELKTHAQMDKYKFMWQSEQGDVPSIIIYDLQKIGEFKIYPKVTDTKVIINHNQPYGIITSIKTLPQPIIFIHDDIVLNDEQTAVLRKLGLARGDISLDTHTNVLKVYYKPRNKIYTQKTDELQKNVSTLVIPAIVSYIVGMCLRDNIDAQDRAKGNEEINLYQQKLARLSITDFDDNVDTQYNINYRTIYSG